ncbi:hypothetical protein P3875_04130 [Myroides sp. JBRI-B21084]|uniref:hypothetical protein n=1 Tax=Myroides sp. JBRI-B21084 TaxID=3119977 RepID=UPI0026E3D1F0|nr:hypothetical protein [Paenimyroides cloacae]WKW47260.1 hypothetical protein P3875_04130 [Paenimyroides cloacae]
MKIQIKDQEFELKFRFSLILKLAKFWKIQHVEKVIQRLNFTESFTFDEEGNVLDYSLPISVFEDLIDVVKIAAEHAGNEITATNDEIADDLFQNTEMMTEIIGAIAGAMPQAKKPVDPSARKAKK